MLLTAGAVNGWKHGAAPNRYPAVRKVTSLEGCAYHIAAQAIPRSACMAIARE